MRVGGQPHAPDALHLGKRPGTNCTGGWVDPEPVWTGAGNLAFTFSYYNFHCNNSVNFFYLQLDAQNSYLFTYNTFIKILYMFRAPPCSSSGGPRRNCIYAASGIVTLCR